MKYILAIFSLLVLSASLQAEERLSDPSFFEEPRSISGVPGKQRHLLVEIPDPGISSSVYALKGMIRHENVEGVGFLQMDNDFGTTGSFFTKSLEPKGPLGKISGTSDWREFVLPFYAASGDQSAGTARTPEKLTLSLVLPGTGTVSIRDVVLYQYETGEDPMRSTGQWFSNRTAGLIGGLGGSVIGLWGALIGVLSSRGKARGFVLGSANTLLVIGIGSLVFGAVALAADQPYVVYYPSLLIGIIVVAVMGKLRGTLSARYEQLELKRMQSLDV